MRGVGGNLPGEGGEKAPDVVRDSLRRNQDDQLVVKIRPGELHAFDAPVYRQLRTPPPATSCMHPPHFCPGTSPVLNL